MEYNGAYVNGICYPNDEFSQDFMDKVKAAVPGLRQRASDLIGSGYIQPTFGFLRSTRFCSNSNIVMRALSGMTKANQSEAELEPRIESFVIAAYLDAAQADHWYTYEKDWGV
jgi:hypothetical protein